MNEEHQAGGRAIIDENTYMTVATSDGARPWAAPVQFCADDDLNLYFVSLPTSRHATHIADNPTVLVTIFDSQQPPFTSRGVQIDGTASAYSENDNPFARIQGLDMPLDLQELLPGYRAFRVEPQAFFVPRAHLEGVTRDERLEVKM